MRGGVAAGALLALAGCVAPSRAPLPGVSAPPARPAASPLTAFRLDGVPRQGALLRGFAPPGTSRLTLEGEAVPVADDGAFVIAFDRDAGPGAVLLAEGDGVSPARLDLSVAPGHWDIQHVDASPTGGVPSAAFKTRRPAELEAIAAARAAGATVVSHGWRQRFIWPVEARRSGVFGSQRVYRGMPGSYHSGVDLAAPAGTVFVAPADGVVTLAVDRPYTLEGKLLIVDHGMGLNSAFLHAAKLLVKTGDVVTQGQPLGQVGATGRASGPHLHWGMKWRDARIDPEPLVGADPLKVRP